MGCPISAELCTYTPPPLVRFCPIWIDPPPNPPKIGHHLCTFPMYATIYRLWCFEKSQTVQDQRDHHISNVFEISTFLLDYSCSFWKQWKQTNNWRTYSIHLLQFSNRSIWSTRLSWNTDNSKLCVDWSFLLYKCWAFYCCSGTLISLISVEVGINV